MGMRTVTLTFFRGSARPTELVWKVRAYARANGDRPLVEDISGGTLDCTEFPEAGHLAWALRAIAAHLEAESEAG